jgi:hypothetical protein
MGFRIEMLFDITALSRSQNSCFVKKILPLPRYVNILTHFIFISNRVSVIQIKTAESIHAPRRPVLLAYSPFTDGLRRCSGGRQLRPVLLRTQPRRARGTQRALLRLPRLDVVVPEVEDRLSFELVARRTVDESHRGIAERHRVSIARDDALAYLIQRFEGGNELLLLHHELVRADRLALPELGLVRSLLRELVLGAQLEGNVLGESRPRVVGSDHPVGLAVQWIVCAVDLCHHVGEDHADVGVLQQAKRVDEAIAALATCQLHVRCRRVAAVQPQSVAEMQHVIELLRRDFPEAGEVVAADTEKLVSSIELEHVTHGSPLFRPPATRWRCFRRCGRVRPQGRRCQ